MSLEIWEDPDPERLGSSAPEMLRRFGGARAVFVTGEDSTRTRVFVTLLHGNEPSGVRAMHAWLRRHVRPAVSCLWIVGAIEAALAEPGFAHRHLPAHRDLNRCFLPPYEGPEGEVARDILDLIRETHPEVVVDLHNNTGHNPPYGIATRADATHRELTSWFAHRLVRSDLRLGALVEATEAMAPSVTIECGRAGDPEADVVALRGASAFLASAELAPSAASPVEVYERPVRVTVRAGLSLAIASDPRGDVDLTLASEIDRYNWRDVEPGTAIGWAAADAGRLPVEACRPSGLDIARDLFVLEDGVLRARRPLVPIMITGDAAIAASDCLFYVVERSDESSPAEPGHLG